MALKQAWKVHATWYKTCWSSNKIFESLLSVFRTFNGKQQTEIDVSRRMIVWLMHLANALI